MNAGLAPGQKNTSSTSTAHPVRLSLKVRVSNLAPTDLYHRGADVGGMG